MLSPAALVVRVTLLPATRVRVSFAWSATTLPCPETAKVPKEFPEPPGIVIVLVAPVPVAVTPAPTKFKVVAAVDKALPSSCTVIAEAVAAIVMLSAELSVVRVMPEPATKVRVSVVLSATTLF